MAKIILNDNHLWSLLHFRKEIYEDLAERGNSVVLIAPSTGPSPELPSGVKYVPVKMNRTSTGVGDIYNYYRQLYAIFRRERPDIVINYTIKPIFIGGLVCKLLKIPSVAFFAGVSNHLSNLFYDSSLKSKIILSVLRRVLKWNKKIVVLNETDYELLKRNRFISPDIAMLLEGGEGVDTQKYHPSEADSKSDGFKIVMVSRVLKSKGYHEFVKAAKDVKSKHPDVSFYLVGGIDKIHPDRINEDEVKMDAADGSFQYLGHINNLPEFIADADSMVLPSYYNEGMNRSLMEALSMGIPIITTNNRGCVELVKDGVTGFIIPPRDAEALSEAICKLYNLSVVQRLDFRKRSREYAIKRFDIEHVKSKYLDLLR